VAVHNPYVVRKILSGDVKDADGKQSGSRSVISRSNMVVQGYVIPAGTLITFDDTA
jgi:hypothetical protein